MFLCSRPRSSQPVEGAFNRDWDSLISSLPIILSVVAYLADEIAIMYLGRIVEYGSVDRVLNQPPTILTRRHSCQPFLRLIQQAVKRLFVFKVIFRPQAIHRRAAISIRVAPRPSTIVESLTLSGVRLHTDQSARVHSFGFLRI